MAEKKHRKLAAILFADIQGYTALMQKDEAKASQLLQKFRNTLNEKVVQYSGEIINNYGDGCLCTFESAVDAMACAKEVQLIFQTAPKVPVRIGLHSGDVFFEDNNVFGDSVNIASRIESLGVAGAVLFSKRIKRDIANQTAFKVLSLGAFHFKNVEKTMEVFGLANEGLIIPKRGAIKGKLKNKKRRPFALWGLLGLLAIMVAGYFQLSKPTAAETSDILNRVIIFPFDVKGGEDLQYLEEGMVDLISTKLDGIPNINPVDPNLVFSKLSKATPPELPQATAIAKELGASKFILGNIVALNDLLQYSVSEYDANGQLLAKKSLEGSKLALATTIDELTKTLIAEELHQEGQAFNSLAALTSNSLSALKNYLQGEQAFRKANPDKAFDYYVNAVEEDSTFAMAWLRLFYANSWSSTTSYAGIFQNLDKYKNKLPQKWQDMWALKMEYYGGVKRGGVAAYQQLIKKYGECREFTNEIGEYLFHLNPVWGKPIAAAKPWLQRTYELDPLNREALIHLMTIAHTENDIPAMKTILAGLEPSAQVYPQFKLRLLATQDTVLESEIIEIAQHPHFRPYLLTFFGASPDNPKKEMALAQRFTSYYDAPIWKQRIHQKFYGVQGKEKLAFETIQKNRNQTNSPDSNNPYYTCIAASIMANNDYLPYSPQYEYLFNQTKNIDLPWQLFASVKYCLALNKGEVCADFKDRLFEKTKEAEFAASAKYFWFSLQAFEAKVEGNFDQTLILIDSAFQYAPSWRLSQAACLDKTFMQADIYEQYGEYDKSIALLENIPATQGYALTKGYATYRLTKLYELAGNMDRALYKSDLFLNLYQDCDEKYKSWVAEVEERRNRLLKLVN